MNVDGRILVIDDSPDDVTLTLRALKKNNITNVVDVASDGEEAIRYLFPAEGQLTTLPALILLDLNMPKVSGLEVLRRIRGDPRTKYLPVVVLTTSTEERDIVNTYDLGANSFVRKPVAFDEFLEAVRVLGMYWLLVNRPVGRPHD
ncbi:response regulator [Actinoplanes xinjiangensis]|uniref:Two-component system response regulator n=1 Tax=Actinoplanes xinjiangensis TaxID=512350 RepID=A0A316FHY5_9ACTN|nr:response regulator [Actinoplanes xinjiangensis]PWK48364.1 two-component system response regulator [Actinoplanes xinjiangensis]GIF38881.1 response regulator [Actinoplanes xinjiangensis]